MPDVLALPLEEARHLLEAAGISVRVSESRPPRGGEGRGALRVIRQQEEGEGVFLTVTHERYERTPGPVSPAESPDPDRPARTP